MEQDPNLEVLTLGGGCFWCFEAIFQNLKGVLSVESGYAGGALRNPTYEQVCKGTTGHAEVVQVEFDRGQITLAELLDVFFHLHDPTTLNRQGYDTGPEYRSIAFYNSPKQEQEIREAIKRIADSGEWSGPIVTEVVPFTEFYPAEKQHQDFYRNNSQNRYCTLIIEPKLQKLFKQYGDKVAGR